MNPGRREAALSSVTATLLRDPVLAERRDVLRRTLRGLPEEMVAALARGLEANAGHLVAGRLFTQRGGGGCAVGVMLRELRPDRFSPHRLRPWSPTAWKRTSAALGGELGRNPRLRHLEWSFDRAVGRVVQLSPSLSPTAAADLVGRWFTSEARAELLRRRIDGPISRTSRSPVVRPEVLEPSPVA
jgi:hypothetical protein